MKRWYHLYVDTVHIKTIRSGWPVSRIMRELEKAYPDGREYEVRAHETEESTYLLKA